VATDTVLGSNVADELDEVPVPVPEVPLWLEEPPPQPANAVVPATHTKARPEWLKNSRRVNIA